MKNGRLLTLLVIFSSVLAGCSTLKGSRAPDMDLGARWILLPSINNTETPQAGGRLDSIAASLLRTHGVADLSLYPAGQGGDALFESADRKSQEAALAWAKKQGARYAVAGTVDEWRYKVGLDGEPAAGISLSIIELSTGRVLWSGTGARTGWSRESVAGVAQELTDDLIADGLSRAR